MPVYISYRVIGNHMRAARKANNLTQEQLAGLLGMSSLHYGRLERGERCASLEQIARIADMLHVPTFSLLSGSLLREPLCAAPTQSSKSFAESLAQITADCTPQELALLKEVCLVFSRRQKAAASQE